MSKSRGNVIYADDLASVFGVDSVRYYVLHEMPYEQDGTITWDLVCERHNSDLANTLGNLVKRTISMINKYFGGSVKDCGVYDVYDDSLKEIAVAAKDKATAKMDEFKVADALDEIWAIFRRANKYIDETTPWILGGVPEKKDRLMTVLYNLAEAISIGASLVKPFMPSAADKILAELGALPRTYDQINQFGLQKEYTVTNEPSTLFERLKMSDLQPEIDKIMDKQKPAEPAPVNEEVKPLITIDDFAKVQMKVGTVVACEAVKKSKLLHETISIGGGKTLSVLSGIGKQYTAEEMVGKRVVVVTNLPPREMKGLLSEGMIICAEGPDGTLSVVSPEKNVPDGSILS